MIVRVEIAAKPDTFDARGHEVVAEASQLGIVGLTHVEVRDLFFLAGATLDEATGTCLLKINPETIITRACDPKAVAPLNASVDAASLSCTLSLTAPVVYQIIAEAEISGDIVCTDGSPKGQPSEPCVLEALKKVSAGQ